MTAAAPVAGFVDAARDADSADRYDVAAAHALPYPAESFDLVVAYNMMMGVENVPVAVAEMARVLRSGGRLIVSIVHPIAGGRGLLLRAAALRGHRGARRPPDALRRLDKAARLLCGGAARAGLAVAAVEEPVADCGTGREHMQPWTVLPLFLWLRCARLG